MAGTKSKREISTFGRALEAIRREQKLTQEKFVENLSLNRSSYISMLYQRHSPGPTLMKSILTDEAVSLEQRAGLLSLYFEHQLDVQLEAKDFAVLVKPKRKS